MRNFKIAVLASILLLAAPASADIVGRGNVAPTITVGGRVFTDLANLKILACSATGATLIRCTMALTTAPTAGYAVTTAKTLRIRAVKFRDDTPASPSTAIFYVSDNDVGQVGVATALTNGAVRSQTFPLLDLTAQLDQGNEFSTNFTIAAAKYLSVQLSAVAKTVYVLAYGYEE